MKQETYLGYILVSTSMELKLERYGKKVQFGFYNMQDNFR